MSEHTGRRRGLFGGAPRAAEPAQVEVPVRSQVPRPLRIAAAYGWRLLVIAAVVALFVWLVIQFKIIVVPVLVAILLTALLWPSFEWMLAKRVPRFVAIVVSLVATIAIVTGLVWLVIWQVSEQWMVVCDRAIDRWAELQEWVLTVGILPDEVVNEVVGFVSDFVSTQSDLLLSGVVSLGSTIGHVGAGALLAFFTLVCLLFDGEGICALDHELFPRQAASPSTVPRATAGPR